MDTVEALEREKLWRSNPRARPDPSTARAVAAALADQIKCLEDRLTLMQSLVVGRHILIHRGNPSRGPESGPGFSRKVTAIIEDVPAGSGQVRCRLLEDDPHAIGAPCRAGESGLWAASQIVVDQIGSDRASVV
jgi:hypothetical protein